MIVGVRSEMTSVMLADFFFLWFEAKTAIIKFLEGAFVCLIMIRLRTFNFLLRGLKIVQVLNKPGSVLKFYLPDDNPPKA